MKKYLIVLMSLMFQQLSSFAHSPSKEKLLDDYLFLKNALVLNNSDSARNYAKELFNDMQSFKPDSLGGKQKKVWKELFEKISYDAEHIKATSEIEHQREHFVKLSDNMFKLLKALAINRALYYQHCPMANNGKGANWISETDEIKNPYMGSKMLNCGFSSDSLNIK